MPTDTSADADRVQLSLLRQAGVQRRASLAIGLSASVVAMSRAAMRARLPNATARELDIAWVRSAYGEKLATALEAHLAAGER